MNRQFWKIGELAKRTGITVRTLHHYDAIGLLSPSRDPQNGHRRYGVQDLERLLRIRALAQLGLSLPEIGRSLDVPQRELAELLREQLARLRRQLTEQQRLLHRLEVISVRLDCGETFAAEDLLDAIEVNMDIEKYYSPEQLATLRAHAENLGDEAVRAAEKEWPELIARMRTEMERGTSPSTPQVAALARRWRELMQMFSGGDAAIETTVAKTYNKEPGLAAKMGLDADLFAYTGRAIAALDKD